MIAWIYTAVITWDKQIHCLPGIRLYYRVLKRPAWSIVINLDPLFLKLLSDFDVKLVTILIQHLSVFGLLAKISHTHLQMLKTKMADIICIKCIPNETYNQTSSPHLNLLIHIQKLKHSKLNSNFGAVTVPKKPHLNTHYPSKTWGKYWHITMSVCINY